MTMPVSSKLPAGGKRILALDAARGIAIIAMISYHFMWDLYFTGFWDVNAARDPLLRFYAKAIAASFLTIAGISLYLAQGRGIRWPSFLKRLAIIAIAALAVSVGSWFAFPQSFIFFGILHCIAVSSVVALPFLRAPLALVFAVAAAAFALPLFIASPALETWPTWWLGLGEWPPASNDYVPLFPWVGFVLVGVGFARLLVPMRDTFAQWQPRTWLGRGLIAAGRYSLIIYLTHQIVLLGILIGLAQIFRPL